MLTGDVLVDENLIRICDIIDNLIQTGDQLLIIVVSLTKSTKGDSEKKTKLIPSSSCALSQYYYFVFFLCNILGFQN